MSKHTPGPWKFQEVDWQPRALKSDLLVFPAKMPSAAIALLYRDNDADEANARLIAAAPDLLEALQSVALHFDEWVIDEEAFEGCLKVRAAIAKATEEGTP